MKRERDYDALAKRLRRLSRRDWRVERAGAVAGYPFFAVRRHVADDAPTVLLTAGMHGDEPAGVEAALRWLENGEAQRWRMNWLVLPCLDPHGWTHNQRTNAQRQDINRQFRNDNGCIEAETIKRLVRAQHFVFAMDLHEDSDASGYYICEIAGDSAPLGPYIVRAVKRLVPVSRAARLDGRGATGLGWVYRVALRSGLLRRKQWPLAFHLIECCAERFLCSETPMDVSFSRRVSAHHEALRAALRSAGVSPVRTATGRKPDPKPSTNRQTDIQPTKGKRDK